MKLFILIVALMIVSCGEEHVVDKYVAGPAPGPSPTPTPTPSGTPTPGGEKISYQTMQGYLITYCQSCHASANFMSSEAALRASPAKDYIWSRAMPKQGAPKALPDNVRTLMLGFF